MYITEEVFYKLWSRRIETEAAKGLCSYWKDSYEGTLLLAEKSNRYCTLDIVKKLELGLKSSYIETVNMSGGKPHTGSLTLDLCNRKWCFVRLI